VGEQVVLGPLEQLGHLGEARPQAVGHPPQLGPGGHLVGLFEDRADGTGDHALGGLGHEPQGIPGGVDDDPTAFPSQDGGAIGAVALDRRTTAYEPLA
jgi:hypothetical protein